MKSINYKVGDKVIITKSVGNWNSDMDKYVGKTVEITHVNSYHKGGQQIRFKNDGGWTWESFDNHFKLHESKINIDYEIY